MRCIGNLASKSNELEFLPSTVAHSVDINVTNDGSTNRGVNAVVEARAGLVEMQCEDLEDNWLPYVKVDDIESTISKVRELGGNLILETEDVATLVDPTGAVFSIQATR